MRAENLFGPEVLAAGEGGLSPDSSLGTLWEEEAPPREEERVAEASSGRSEPCWRVYVARRSKSNRCFPINYMDNSYINSN